MNVEKLLFSGINSDYYEYEDGNVVKLFKKGQKAEFVLNEYNKAKAFEAIKLAPKAVEMVKLFQREGIVYKMTVGETVLDLAINAHDPIYAANTIFESMNKINIEGIKLESYKELLQGSIKKAHDAKEINDNVYNTACEIIKNLPEGNVVCNSMLEPNNIILKHGVEVVTEWDMAVLGVKEYELARIYTHLMVRTYPEKGYAEKSIKEFLNYTYQALVKLTNLTIADIKDYVYVCCCAMLGEYVEYGTDKLLKEFIRTGEF